MEDGFARLPELRSSASNNHSFVCFINNSERNVSVMWVNYVGQSIVYRILPPSSYFNVNTFETHPWMFKDSKTHDTLVVKSKEVFFPQPSVTRPDGITRQTAVYITIPVYSLKQRALQIARNNITQVEDVLQLELPEVLQTELLRMVQTRNGLN